MKNYGVNLELEKQHQSEKDWLFGATSKQTLAQIPPEERKLYLPLGEIQNIGSEKMDCASRSPINNLETQFNYLFKNDLISDDNKGWLVDKGYVQNEDNRITFSDAFIAILSGTTRGGNSLKAPIDAIHTYGLIPKDRLPQLPDFDEYYNPARITPELKALGAEFAKRFPITYEKVLVADFPIVKDMVCVAGYAWPPEENGEYPRVPYSFNHAFLMYQPAYFIFDNYIADSSFVKKLANNYLFMEYGFRLIVSENRISETPQKKSPESGNWLTKLLAIFGIKW